jgi:hypothetical protein
MKQPITKTAGNIALPRGRSCGADSPSFFFFLVCLRQKKKGGRLLCCLLLVSLVVVARRAVSGSVAVRPGVGCAARWRALVGLLRRGFVPAALSVFVNLAVRLFRFRLVRAVVVRRLVGSGAGAPAPPLAISQNPSSQKSARHFET